jgi:predicted component of type VI protein secretion system
MAQVADYGLVLWDGKSQGSCNNLKELLRQNKKALVYYSPRKQFTRVATLKDLHGLLSHHLPRASYDQGALAI